MLLRFIVFVFYLFSSRTFYAKSLKTEIFQLFTMHSFYQNQFCASQEGPKIQLCAFGILGNFKKPTESS